MHTRVRTIGWGIISRIQMHLQRVCPTGILSLVHLEGCKLLKNTVGAGGSESRAMCRGRCPPHVSKFYLSMFNLHWLFSLANHCTFVFWVFCFTYECPIQTTATCWYRVVL